MAYKKDIKHNVDGTVTISLQDYNDILERAEEAPGTIEKIREILSDETVHGLSLEFDTTRPYHHRWTANLDIRKNDNILAEIKEVKEELRKEKVDHDFSLRLLGSMRSKVQNYNDKTWLSRVFDKIPEPWEDPDIEHVTKNKYYKFG